MTLRQQAHGLIDRLPESCIRPMVQIMNQMLPAQEIQPRRMKSPKMQAFEELQEMRRDAVKYRFTEDDRAVAVDEKYGSFQWSEAET